MSDIENDHVKPEAAAVNAGAGAADGRGPAHRLVLTVVIVLGILILIGFAALIVGVAMKMKGHHGGAGLEAGAALSLPAGAQIETMQVSGNRLILRLKTDGGEEIDIVDTGDGHLVSRLRDAPPDVPPGVPNAAQ